MADIEALLTRWQSAGVLDTDAARRIRAWELEQAGGAGQRSKHLGWQGMVALILGAIILACGVILFVSAHWEELGPGARFGLVLTLVGAFHLAGALTRRAWPGLGSALHAVGTVSTGAAIALTGQIFNIQEHWPGAVLLWAVAALFGWILLGDEAQQTLTMLLFPAWICSEMADAMQDHIGQPIFIGRLLAVWAILYLTVLLDSRRKAVQGILFAAAAIAGVAATVLLLEGWRSWSESQTLAPLGVRVWAWVAIALLPLLFAFFRPAKSFIPVCTAIGYALALPWCSRKVVDNIDYGTYHQTDQYSVPNLAAHALVALFAVFLIWWGVRRASRALVNLGIGWFAIAVGWFYFSDIFDKVGRSLGLIGLGVLFLVGGWALERMRRRLISHMNVADPAKEVE